MCERRAGPNAGNAADFCSGGTALLQINAKAGAADQGKRVRKSGL
jgi:hypothetical protein